MDKIYEICFSPTGGTKRVAAILAKALADETVSVDLTVRDVDFGSVTLGKDDVAMIAVPSYSGRVPAVAAACLAEMHGNGARAILVCVYGNRAYEDTLVGLRDTASRAGFTVIEEIHNSLSTQLGSFASMAPTGHFAAQTPHFTHARVALGSIPAPAALR